MLEYQKQQEQSIPNQTAHKAPKSLFGVDSIIDTILSKDIAQTSSIIFDFLKALCFCDIAKYNALDIKQRMHKFYLKNKVDSLVGLNNFSFVSKKINPSTIEMVRLMSTGGIRQEVEKIKQRVGWQKIIQYRHRGYVLGYIKSIIPSDKAKEDFYQATKNLVISDIKYQHVKEALGCKLLTVITCDLFKNKVFSNFNDCISYYNNFFYSSAQSIKYLLSISWFDLPLLTSQDSQGTEDRLSQEVVESLIKNNMIGAYKLNAFTQQFEFFKSDALSACGGLLGVENKNIILTQAHIAAIGLHDLLQQRLHTSNYHLALSTLSEFEQKQIKSLVPFTQSKPKLSVYKI